VLKGSYVALVTPFNVDGSINFDKLRELIEYHINNKTAGLVILGTTGEATTISLEEQIEVVKFSLEVVNKRIPVMIGSGSNDTKKACELSKLYSSMGADYLLVVTPYYNKTNTPGLIKHFEMIAEASSCPIVLYNVPSRTGMNIPIPAYEVLCKHPNIVGVKEASGNMDYTNEVCKYLSDDFVMLSGNDDIIVDMIKIGASGVISVLANIAPMNTQLMCEYALNKDFDKAYDLQNSLLDVANSLFYETNPIPVKAAMNYLGFNVGGYRMPLYEMSIEPYNKMVNVLNSNKEYIK
jgi:4-hydroxy-tetrahydrodipicolinate synthase